MCNKQLMPSCLVRSKLKTFCKERRRLMERQDLEKMAALPNSPVVIEKSIENVVAELGNPDFLNLEGGRCTCLT